MSIDLVERLRALPVTGDHLYTAYEAADQMEFLHGHLARLAKRFENIEILMKRLDGYRASIESNDRHIKVLEAALREIADHEGIDDYGHVGIARRALENKK